MMNDSLLASIRARYQDILAQIGDAAAGCGRLPAEVRLVVVSKLQPLGVIRAAISAGITAFGENYAEEAVEKIIALKNPQVEWHMIGHVQSRKAGMVVANFALLHSLDSQKLATRLERYCIELNRTLPVLLEFNMSGEESKSGFPAWNEDEWSSLEEEIGRILTLPHLRVQGLMTMPPYSKDPESSRSYFQKLRRLQAYLTSTFPKTSWKELSMGTSVDFLVAIQEGATFVRIGQSILGQRIMK
jgi:pyridoxal phosphate enzyme (YggS family)